MAPPPPMPTSPPAPAQASLTMEKRKQDILDALDGHSEVVLIAESGTMHTWLAREIGDSLRNKFHPNPIIWLFLKRNLDDKSLYETIASQISLLSPEEDMEEDDSDKKGEEESNGMFEIGKLERKIKEELKEKECLWILQGAGNDNGVVENLKTKLKGLRDPSKILITETRSSGSTERDGTITPAETKKEIFVEPLSPDESWSLFLEKVNAGKQPGTCPIDEASFKKFFGKLCFPGEIVVMAKTLRSLLKQNPEDKRFQDALEEITKRDSSDTSEVLRIAYEMLPTLNMINCGWNSRQYFRIHDSVHHIELITYWILDGHLDPIDRIEKAYNEGHVILMELLERGFLKEQVGNFVTMEHGMLEVDDLRPRGYAGTASLGLACLFEVGIWEGLGRITPRDGMVKSVSYGNKWEKISTLVIDRHRLSREVPDSFLPRLKGLKVLTLFDSRLISLSFLSNLPGLQMLVLRGCPLIVNIDPVKGLKSLYVLEISGAISLREISDNLFDEMPHLRSLNLSGAPIRSLPSSIFERRELRWLILRKCSQLEELPGMKKLTNLLVLDLSGASQLKTIRERRLDSKKLQMLDLSCTLIAKIPFLHDLDELARISLRGCSKLQRIPRLTSLPGLHFLDLSNTENLNEIQDGNLLMKNTLVVVNLSKSAIKWLPSVSNLYNLNLNGCEKLESLPLTTALRSLQLMDLSDSSRFNQIDDQSFEHLKYLQVLNISNTKVQSLPSLSNLHFLRLLLLKNCSELKTLPEMDGLSELELLDLSGCFEVREVPELRGFQKLKVLNLSETGIEGLPSLSDSPNLSDLLLRNCQKLQRLPPSISLSKLEKLDLCGSTSLGVIQDDFFENMDQLWHLDLSKVPLLNLPSMSKLINLKKLLLEGCSEIKRVPDLDEHVKLEVLDLSGTKVEALPEFLTQLNSLRRLLLKDCPNFKSLPSLKSLSLLENLDLSGTGITEYPKGISESTRLRYIGLPSLELVAVEWGNVKCLPEQREWHGSVIKSFAQYIAKNGVLSITVMGTTFFHLLKAVFEQGTSFSETTSGEFHISVRFSNQKPEFVDQNNHCHVDHFQEIYSATRKSRCLDGNFGSLEVRNFDELTLDMEDALGYVQHVSLIDNSFSPGLSTPHLSKTKSCWVEKCNEMESILCFSDENAETGSNLEELWISDMSKLKTVARASSNLQPGSFGNLKRLYLKCCPQIVTVFPSPVLPKVLKTLQVQFCDSLETVFEDESELQTLTTLDLLELPELKKIGGTFPKLEVLKVRECPQVEEEFQKIKEACNSSSTPLED